MPVDISAALASLEYRRRRKSELYWLKQNKFYATTPFSGFIFIHVAKSRLECVFWYAIVAVFFCVTIHEVHNLVAEYFDSDHGTKVSISEDSHTHILPDLMYCIKNDWKTHYETLETHYSYLKKALQLFDTRAKFLGDNWDYSMLVGTVNVLLNLDLCDTNRTDADDVHRLITSHISDLNISFAQLRDKFSEQYLLLHQPQLGIGKHGSLTREPRFLGVRHSWVDKNVRQVCYTMPANSEAFRLILNSSKIEQQLHKNHTISGQKLPQLKNISVYLYQGFPYASSHLIEAKIGTSSYGKITVTGSYQSSSITERNKLCTNDLSVNECRLLEKANYIKAHCGCVPLLASNSFPDIYSQENICGCSSTDQCSAYAHEINQHPCLPPCSKKFYITSSYQSVHSREYLSLHIEMGRDEYPVFLEQPKSLSEFLAELGGALDFWLGASVIGLVHLVVYLVKQIAYLCNKNTKTYKHVQKTIDNFRMAPLFNIRNTQQTDDDAIDVEERLERLENNSDIVMKDIAKIYKQLATEGIGDQ